MHTLRDIMISMRPRQWVKNGLVFTGVIFAGKLGEAGAIARSFVAFAVFCALSGAVYLVNDVRDREQDRRHEAKRLRPVASGALPPGTAIAAAAVLATAALVASLALGVPFAVASVAFLLLQAAYTFVLKHVVVLDVLAIAAGFVVRALAGILAISVSVSPWLLSCAALLATFLGLAKRRHELLLLQEAAEEHRAALGHYKTRSVDAALWVLTAVTIAAYALYAFLSATAQRHGLLLLTVPFVVFGLMRYRYLVYRHDVGGKPEEVLLTDVPMVVDVTLWLVTAIVAMSL